MANLGKSQPVNAIYGGTLNRALKTTLFENPNATDVQLGRSLGYTSANIGKLAGRPVTATQVAKIVKRTIEISSSAAQRELVDDWINTVVEFYPISKTKTSHDKYWEIFDKLAKKHKLLYEALFRQAGLYAFYNSEASIIYLGQTQRCLWTEAKNAFNRSMDSHQIWTVYHPPSKGFADVRGQQHRRIARRSVKLHETATFFSAYVVDHRFVERLEALFIRVLPNNLTNVRIENLTRLSVG
jgi:hypothetical protein